MTSVPTLVDELYDTSSKYRKDLWGCSWGLRAMVWGNDEVEGPR